MAKFTHVIQGDFDQILNRIEKGVLDASVSATLEDGWDVRDGNSRCSVRVFERYSYAGGNRVSMNVTLFQAGNAVRLCAITSGGSQALFFKVNTLGEETFLDTLKDVIRHL
jgi:hypothetical protein